MKNFGVLMGLIISCSSVGEKQNIEILDLQKEYKKSQDISFSLKSNAQKRIYYHFEGECYLQEVWRPFDNDILSRTESNQESNLWFEPKSKLDFHISSIKFLQKFSSPPDSFRIKIMYWYVDDEVPKLIYSNSFTLNK